LHDALPIWPAGQLQPAIGAHEEHPHGRLVTDPVGHAFQPVVEPPQTQWVQVDGRLGAEVQFPYLPRAVCQRTMDPGTDDQPLACAAAFASATLVNALEASDDRVAEDIEPPAEVDNGHVDLGLLEGRVR